MRPSGRPIKRQPPPLTEPHGDAVGHERGVRAQRFADRARAVVAERPPVPFEPERAQVRVLPLQRRRRDRPRVRARHAAPAQVEKRRRRCKGNTRKNNLSKHRSKSSK